MRARGWRGRPAEELLPVAAAEAKRLGAIRPSKLSGLDQLGVPCWQVIRPDAIDTPGNVTVLTGKAWTDDEALLGAYMEAIERHWAECCCLPTIIAKPSELQAKGEWYVPLAVMPLPTHITDPGDQPLAWVRGTTLEGRSILVPAHAVRLTNSGRLFIVPVLLEPKGMIDAFTPEQVIDLTATPRDFGKLHDILAPDPMKLSEAETKDLSATVAQFDKLFLDEQWDASDNLLRRSPHFEHTFDYEFRRMLHSIYTANQTNLDAVLNRLHSTYGSLIVYHIYKGYCDRHLIPNRMTVH